MLWGYCMIVDILMQQIMKNDVPFIDIKRCINEINGGFSCAACVQMCPEKALEIKNNSIVIHSEQCSECHICKAVCPTEAVKIQGNFERGILNKCEEKNIIVFSCSKNHVDGHIKLHCINQLNSRFIALILLCFHEKEIHFNLSECKYCKNPCNEDYFVESLNKALKFTESLNVRTNINVCYERNSVPHVDDTTISRRSLFLFLKKQSENTAIKVLNSLAPYEKEIFLNNMLLNYVKSLECESKLNSVNMFWKYRDVNENCDGCGKCVSSCPTEAWKIEKDAENINIYHKFANCCNCGICETVCPQNAISAGMFDNNSIENEKYELKRNIKLRTCVVCNKQFVSVHSEADMCNVCKKKSKLRILIEKNS